MRFRGDVVWVRADEQGKLVLDSDGRAEMRYRQTDERAYRPSPRNLEADTGADSVRAPDDLAPDAGVASKHEAPARPARISSTETIAIWTDGACTGNPGPMGIGMVVLAGSERLERGEFLGTGTNNIAELTAVDRGLDLAETLRPGLPGKISVYTDSSYTIGVLSRNWKAKANQALIARMRKRLVGLGNVSFVKVAGHAGVPLNERCDELARAAIKERGTV